MNRNRLRHLPPRLTMENSLGKVETILGNEFRAERLCAPAHFGRTELIGMAVPNQFVSTPQTTEAVLVMSKETGYWKSV